MGTPIQLIQQFGGRARLRARRPRDCRPPSTRSRVGPRCPSATPSNPSRTSCARTLASTATRSASRSCAGCSSSRSSTTRTRSSSCCDAELPLADSDSRCSGAPGRPIPEGITGDALLDFVNDELFPALKELPVAGAGRPPARRARRVRGRLQLHEVRPVDAAGRQQDQRGRLQQPGRAAALRRHLRADPQRPAERRQRRRVLHAARRDGVHGGPHRPAARRNPARPGLRHRRLPDLRDPSHARAATSRPSRTRSGCSRRCGPSRRSSCRTCCASPTCCCTASRIPASSATTTRWRARTSATPPADRVDIVLTNPPFGGTEEDGIESQLPEAVPDPRDGRPVPGADHPAAQARRSRRGGAARRLAVRRGREDAAEGAPAGGVQPAHDRPAAQQRLQAVREHRHQPAVLREGRADARRSGSTSTACPRARRPTR